MATPREFQRLRLGISGHARSLKRIKVLMFFNPRNMGQRDEIRPKLARWGARKGCCKSTAAPSYLGTVDWAQKPQLLEERIGRR